MVEGILALGAGRLVSLGCSAWLPVKNFEVYWNQISSLTNRIAQMKTPRLQHYAICVLFVVLSRACAVCGGFFLTL